MNKYFTDCYKQEEKTGCCIENNSEFSVFSFKDGLSSNEAELLSILCTATVCEEGSEIYSDSSVAVGWVTNGLGKKSTRKDLEDLVNYCSYLCSERDLTVYWIPREVNLAGIYNDKVLDRDKDYPLFTYNNEYENVKSFKLSLFDF